MDFLIIISFNTIKIFAILDLTVLNWIYLKSFFWFTLQLLIQIHFLLFRIYGFYQTIFLILKILLLFLIWRLNTQNSFLLSLSKCNNPSSKSQILLLAINRFTIILFRILILKWLLFVRIILYNHKFLFILLKFFFITHNWAHSSLHILLKHVLIISSYRLVAL